MKMAACLKHEWNTQHYADRYEQQGEHLWHRLLYWRLENETAYTVAFLYQMFSVFWEQIIPYVGKTRMLLSNLNLSYLMLSLEVIFPQIEIASAREAVITFKWAIPFVLHIIIKKGRVSQIKLVNILLVRSFIYVAYHRSFQLHVSAFFLGHHQVDCISYSRQPYKMQY
jgi:hypothetical protein